MLTAISRESWETHLQLGVNTFIYAVQSICQNTTRLCLVKYSNTISNVACLASLSGEPEWRAVLGAVWLKRAVSWRTDTWSRKVWVCRGNTCYTVPASGRGLQKSVAVK